MKFFSFIILIILIAFTSCDLTFEWNETSEWYTRMVLVQTEDNTRCTKARLIREYPFRDTLYADGQGKFPVSIKSTAWIKSDSNGYSSTIFKDDTDIHKWEGRIYYYKNKKYEEFYVIFPND